MPNLKPFRVVDEHDVINLYRFSPSGTYPLIKGTFVKVISGWMNDQNLLELGAVGAVFGNTVSQRYGIEPYVVTCTSSGDVPLGMTLYDVRETDENGEKLIFNPTKQAQMQAVLSGQAVPIVTKGVFLYSGAGGTPEAGKPAYLNTDGTITSAGTRNAIGVGDVTRVGTFLGPKDVNDWVLFKLDL